MNPEKYDIYEDATGSQVVLIEEYATGVWLSVRIQGVSLCFVSRFQISKMHRIGRALFK
jgi:hypothetical protein